MERTTTRVLAIVLVCAGVQPVSAKLLINEIYYDHPGADTGHEFVELVSSDGGATDLAGVTLEFHNGTGVGWTVIWRAPAGAAIPADGCFVVGGELVVPRADAVTGLSLQNGPDALRIVSADGDVHDVVGYGGLDDPAYVETLGVEPVSAGQSIARVRDAFDTDDNAADFVAAVATPGRRNVARHDVALLMDEGTPARAVRPGARRERIGVRVVNLGVDAVPAGSVSLRALDATDSGTTESVHEGARASIGPGASARVDVHLELASGTHWIRILAEYPPDERASNDTLLVVRRVGRIPVLVSEVWSSPRAGCPQFVELVNVGDTHVDVSGFSLRDTRGRPVRLSEEVRQLAPGACLVVTPDPGALLACVTGAAASRVIGTEGTWPTFNRTGGDVADSVVVLDALDIPVDAVAYPGLPASAAGRSLERIDLFLASTATVWRVSDAPGGCTPGARSHLALKSSPPPGTSEASPNPFYPHNGEVLRVAVSAVPDIARVVVSVFDVDGRREAELGSASSLPAVFVWDGRDARGGMAAPGLYVVACELFDAGDARRAVHKLVVGCGVRR